MKKTCEFCEHFEVKQLLSVGRDDGDVYDDQSGCWRKVEHTYTRGTCGKMVESRRVKKERYPDSTHDVVEHLDRIHYTTRAGDQNRSNIGKPKVGPDFGCIHWEKRKTL